MTAVFQHPRKLIRHAAADLLMNATIAGARVYRSRFLNHFPDKLPALSVYTLDTSTVEGTQESAPRILEHSVSLTVEGMFRIEAPEDDENPSEPPVYNQADDLAFVVEQLFAANSTLGGKCIDCFLTGTTLEQVETRDAVYGVITFTFAANYERAYPNSIDYDDIDDFLTADIRYRPNRVGAGDEANDVVSLPGP